jgi:hypothetical protein
MTPSLDIKPGLPTYATLKPLRFPKPRRNVPYIGVIGVNVIMFSDFLINSHRKKRMKQLQKKIKSGTLDVKTDDPFELFVSATNIRYCYYNETHKILGNTYGMCVLQVSTLFQG